MKKNNICERNSLNTSICSNICQEDQSNENAMLNRALKDKYDRMSKNLSETNRKFCDDIYPPLWSSLSLTNKQ